MDATRVGMLGLLSVLWALSGCGRDADTPRSPRNASSGPAADGGEAGAGRDADPPSEDDNPRQPITPPPGAATDGAAGTTPVGECAAVTRSAKISKLPADIIFGVDTSASMSEEIGFVQQNMNAFSQRIIDSGIDARVILVAAVPMTKPGFLGLPETSLGVCITPPLGSGSCPEDSNPPLYAHVEREIGSNDVLSGFIDAYPQYREHLRENSLKTFVSVTDDNTDNAGINSAEGFIAALQYLEPKNSAIWSNYRYSSIYCFSACPEGDAEGSVHRELVAKTRGVEGDLCQQNFTPVFDALARQVEEGSKLSCDWLIPAPPAGEKLDVGRTNVQLILDGEQLPIDKVARASDCRDREGWHYDDEEAPTRVVSCPASCSRVQSAAGASIDISFGCETRIAPD